MEPIRGPRLEGKVAVVTGGGSRGDGIGTGRAASIVFAREGARVAVVDRDRAAAQTTVDMIKAEGGVAAAVEADLSSYDACVAMADEASGLWGRIDILDNNVGREGRGTILEVDEAEWDAVLGVNVKSTVFVSKAIIPKIIASGGGAIVNISSISAWCARGLTPYTTAKGAVISLTRAMAVDHAAQGIRVNCIAPGPLYTPMVSSAGMDEELRERRKKASLLQIEGTAWDVGHAALYLVSDEARYVTGVLLPVDGGVSIRSPDR
ncbi:NAD(P)-dependent dehydrogenase (short-subunit alcohol dehydrogenase family) [Antricoccus suffuscus]|uniref:NAD(P)-dependent dehydrogenase (Short-subunit alcohol dehydrogenase family) n=1 Tax=Antricoccus suffuscus TaxID=1629062 RepID=A0A2T1A144_9ACTN|nr:SDR family oxidoreductase [Antricoccus suffuscus]PRZ42325.1 NAD(P)-dependent dehydrogenase (short-subunit alcohol dehydrogenase family) [Antricoccus suffuscus]